MIDDAQGLEIPVLGVRLEPEVERQLGKSHSTCMREALHHYLQRFGNAEEARRQSQLLAAQEPQGHWSEQLPDWGDWTA
ncbi:hypothetical protein [Cyanobium sp. LEGE 06113]|uniref:hypothetical protein n=1 Tax=Cyanobium sp. LEGE 06113 TaxID=1297573 RepID=UPI001880D127|nr:hypothetical protein [Cyanobium sp. LEGE 06113]MBE9153432.1 hypothetical protein [Cyanobium sp. LEGE 06113]